MRKFRLYQKFYFACILIFVFFSQFAFSQNKSNRVAYIENKLNIIDSLIEVKDYKTATLLIENTRNTFSFNKSGREKLAFDFRTALILYKKGKEDDALEMFLIGFEKLKNINEPELYIKYADILAKIFVNSQNFDRGIYYNKLALKKAKSINDTLSAIKSLIRLGSFFYAKEELDSAKSYFRKVTYYPVNNQTEQRISNAFNNLGVIAGYEQKYDLARYRTNQALEIKKRQKDSLGIVLLTVNMGNLFHYQEKYKNAIKNYNEALKTIEKDSSKDAINFKKIIYENLSVSYDSLKDYKNAFRNLEKSDIIRNVIFEKQLKSNISEVEGKYNLALEEKRTEEESNKAFRAQVLFGGLAFVSLTLVIIGLIFYKNYKLQQQNRFEQIQNSLQTRIINATIDAKEKERKNIAEILHDSVSALLSSANLHLQASKVQLKSKVPAEISKTQEIINEASVKIRDLSHELISSVLLKFGLAFAVHDLCEKYSNSEINFISDDNGVKRYNQKFEIKIYNIIEELVNNILKHSKAKNASIKLIERNGNTLIIQIIDDGQGFDLKSVREKDGLGLNHIDARIKYMKGVFNINTKKGEGTSIYISVPIYDTATS